MTPKQASAEPAGQRPATEARIRRLTRASAIMTDICRAIVDARELPALFDRTCHVLVGECGFRMAWIGLADDVGGAVRGAAHAGIAHDYLKGLQVTLSDEPLGRGPTGTAHRTGRHVVVNDIATDPRMAPWRERALREGYRASAAFPLCVAGEMRGTVNLYASEPGFFDEEEIALLDHLTGSIALAVELAEQTARRARAEELLREREKLLSVVADNFPGLVSYIDRDLRYRFASRGYEQVFGIGPDAVLGRTPPEVIGAEVFKRAEPYMRRALAGEQVTFENPTRTASGEDHIALNTFVPDIAADGEVRGFVVAAMNITERKRAERAQAAETIRRRVLFEQAKDGIFTIDEDRRVIEANPSFAAMLGYTAEEVCRLHPWDWDVEFSTREALLTRWPELPQDRQTFETKIRRKDGTTFDAEISYNPAEWAGKKLVFHVCRDISERKEMQAQFQQAQKMESVGRLAGGIAHDFNNLLTVINGTAALALMKLKEKDPGRAEFQQVLRAGERAASLTRHLLAFSRRQILKPDVLNLNKVIADMQGMLRRLIGEHIHQVFVPAKNLGSVRADQGQIEQVILNLAVNAQDAMPDGGTLTIETRNVELDEAHAAEHPSVEPGSYVMLAISDTGTGMDDATRAQIFEPFFTTKDTGKGTGLGLSTVYGIVKQSGGSIWVFSEPGRGATFKVYLPRVGDVARKTPSPRPATATQGTETILVVEDEPALREIAERVLESAGYTVLSARSGAEALPLVERHDGPVHLMLTDVVMPGMSGRDLAGRVAALRPEMKVLYMSGYTDDAVLRHGVLEKAANFISKPYTIEELTRMVRDVLDS